MQAGADGENPAATSEREQNIIFGIEEPELYQHPNRQRHLSSILEKLCSGGIPGATRSVQVIYTTHSPLFVDIGHFERIKIVRKVQNNSVLPKETTITSTTPEDVQTALDEVEGRGGSSRATRPLEFQLRTIMTPIVNEGFFSDVVVLVEGEEDRAALIGTARAMEIDLSACGISVIPCNGKDSLPKVGTVFRHLKIPLYVVWDSDKGKNTSHKATNHKLLRLCGHPEEDWPAGVFDRYACFETNLTETLRRELGEEYYDRALAEIQRGWGLGNWDGVKKNPLVVAELINKAKEGDISPSTIVETVERIVTLRGSY